MLRRAMKDKTIFCEAEELVVHKSEGEWSTTKGPRNYRPKAKATMGHTPNGIVLKDTFIYRGREKSILIKLLGVPEPYAQTKVQSVGYNRVEDPPSISTGSNKYSVPWEENNLLF